MRRMSNKGFTMVEALITLAIATLLIVASAKYFQILNINRTDTELYAICSDTVHDEINTMNQSVMSGAELKTGMSCYTVEKNGPSKYYNKLIIKNDIEVSEAKAFGDNIYNIKITASIVGVNRIKITTNAVIYRSEL